MIDVVDKEIIRRLYFVQGKSMRWIARELKMSRKTVRKALNDALPPEYNLTKSKPRPVTGPIQPIVEQWLLEDQERPKKQRHTADKIYERLVEEYNYQGSKASVHMLVHKLRQKERETYIPLSFEPGTNAQCDWGTVTVILAGEPVKVELFAIRLTNSRLSFCQVFPSQRQEAFFEGHRRAFEFFGGVPLTITYDNLKTAVFKILKGRNRIEQQAFIAFRGHYLFESVYCNAGRGNEKGQVENLIGFLERNIFTPIPEADSLAELNSLLTVKCLAYAKNHQVPGKDLSIEQAFLEERKLLLPLPQRPFDCCRVLSVKASESQLVRFENNFYSVPAPFVGRSLVLKAYVDRVEIYAGHSLIAAHPRSYGTKHESLNLDHYLDTLLRKPGALTYARPFKAANLPPVYHQYLAKLKEYHAQAQKEFVKMLLLNRQCGWDNLTEALEEAYRQGIYHAEGLKHIVERLTGKYIATPFLPAERCSGLNNFKVERPELNKFNRLLGGVLH